MSADVASCFPFPMQSKITELPLNPFHWFTLNNDRIKFSRLSKFILKSLTLSRCIVISDHIVTSTISINLREDLQKKKNLKSFRPRTFVHPGNLHQVLRERNLYRKTGTRRDKYLKWPAVLLLVFNAATRIWRNSFPLQSPRNTMRLLLASRRCVLFICIFSNSNTWVSSSANGWKTRWNLGKLFLL